VKPSCLFLGCGLLCGSAAFLTGCGSKVATTSRPLIDAQHGAVVLVEGKVLSNPHSVDQNRLLRGWRFIRHDNGRRLMPTAPESVAEIVHLKRRSRRLIIHVDEHRPGDSVRAGIGRRSLGIFPISDRTEIDLPADLPIGRAAVTLGFSNIETTVLSSLSIPPSLAQGSAAINPDAIEQSGWSAVEVVHRLTPGARFKAAFHPPASANPTQRFSVTVQYENDRSVEVYSWDPHSGRIDTDPLSVDVPLGDGTGPARILLLAEGAGPAGRWVDARIVDEQAPPVQVKESVIGEPPRLVVLYVMDALRADQVKHLGRNPGLTPVLDGLATEGATFTNHLAVAPNTPPSTRALFSGLCMLDDRQLPSPGPTRLAEVFRETGYRTVSITGNPHLSQTLDLGTGFDSVEMLRVREDHHPKHPPTVNNSAEILHETALRWIDNLGPDERGFLYIHSMNPHNPYTPPRELADRFAPPGASTIDGRTRTLVAIRDQQLDVKTADMDRLRKLYAAGVAYNDRELGILLDQISRRFDPEQVFVALTSDHGEELFEHGGVLHGYNLYDEMLRIPLILRWPDNINPGKIDSLTNTLDLHASMVELASGAAGDSTGSSLWPLMSGMNSPDPRPRLTFAAAPGLAGATMVRSGRWKLIRVPRNGPDRGQGKGRGRSWDSEYVFDLENDPEEQHNVAGIAELEVAWLRTRLMAWIEAQRAMQPSPGDQVMDDETKDQLEALGYVVDQ